MQTNNAVYDFIKAIDLNELPQHVVAHGKRCLLDLLATLAAGSRTQAHGISRGFAARHFAHGSDGPFAVALSSNSRLSPSGAAWLDGNTIDSMDAHDGHALTKGHVGCAVLASLAASVDPSDRVFSGASFLTMLIAGYEIGTRSGIVLHATTPDFHSTGAWNAVTCAAIVAHRLGSTAEQYDHALGIAEYHGPRSQIMRDVDHPTMVKDGSGWGAMCGTSAAYLALEGYTGAPALTVMAPEVQSFWSDLGERWRILETYFKPYPVCRWAHPAIDAVLALARTHNLREEDVEGIEVATFHEATRLSQNLPRTSDQAQYGIKFPIAVSFCRGEVAPEHVMESHLNDRDVLKIFDKIVISEHEPFSVRFPAERLARVQIRLKSGALLTSDEHIARGDPKNPLSDDEIHAKFFKLTSSAWSEEKTNAVFDLVKMIDDRSVYANDLLTAVRA